MSRMEYGNFGALMSAMYEERRPGCCLVCDRPLPPQTRGRKRSLCGHPECKRTYLTLAQADLRARRRELQP